MSFISKYNWEGQHENRQYWFMEKCEKVWS